MHACRCHLSAPVVQKVSACATLRRGKYITVGRKRRSSRGRQLDLVRFHKSHSHIAQLDDSCSPPEGRCTAVFRTRSCQGSKRSLQPLSSFSGITTCILQVLAACAFVTRGQQLSSSRQLSAQTRHRTHRTRATQQPYSAQPGVVRGFRLRTYRNWAESIAATLGVLVIR